MNILYLLINVKILHHFISDLQNTVAFSAYSRQSKTLSSYSTLVFEKVALNEGQGYSAGTGVFTCPVSGLYVFTWTLQTTENKSLNAYITRNGGSSNRFLNIRAETSEYAAESNTEVMHLNKGDTVYIQGAGYFKGIAVSSFNGWKIN